MRDDRIYLQHILDAIQKIESYLDQIDEYSFFSSTLLQDGVIRQIEIIGEAAKHLSSEFKNKYSAVQWKYIAGMRDKLIHDYFGVDIQQVWLTAREDLPILRENILTIFGELNIGS
jgi:uncharacterized protein with HEPN domain